MAENRPFSRGAREDAILGTVGGVGTAMAGMDFTQL